MNLQAKFSQKKLQHKGRIVQTDPCESPHNSPIYYESISTDNPPFKLTELINCSSPTFASADNLSIRSVRCREKENISNNNDWKLEAQMTKGHSQKLAQINAILQKENGTHKKQLSELNCELLNKDEQIQYLNNMLGQAKIQLQKRIKEEFGYLKYFEVMNSSDEKQHIDIYLEMNYLKNLYTEGKNANTELLNRLSIKQKELNSWLVREKKFQESIRQFNQTIQKLSRLNQQLRHSAQSSASEYRNLKELNEQVNKQRHLAVKKIKELEAEIGTLTKSIEQFEADQEGKFMELEKSKEHLQKVSKLHETCKKEKEQLSELLRVEKSQRRSKVEDEDRQASQLKLLNSQLEAEVSRLQSQLQSIRRKAEREQASASRLTKTLSQEINHLKELLESEQTTKRVSESKLQSLQLAILTHSSEIVQAKQTKVSLQKTLLARDQQLGLMKSRMTELALTQQHLSKEIQFYQEKIDHLERQEKSTLQKVQSLEKDFKELQYIKNYEIQLKQEVIRKLIGFVPAGEAKKVLEDYLLMVEQMAESGEQDNNRLQVIARMESVIKQHKDRLKNLDGLQRKYEQLKAEYDNLRKTTVASETRRTETSLESNRRRMISKYYA